MKSVSPWDRRWCRINSRSASSEVRCCSMQFSVGCPFCLASSQREYPSITQLFWVIKIGYDKPTSPCSSNAVSLNAGTLRLW